MERYFACTVNGCQVDTEDAEYLKRFKWYTNRKGYSFFYRRSKGKTSYRVYMHWIVLNLHGVQNPKYSEVDHIDRNKQNNHFSNLRVVTRAINLSNQSKPLLTEREVDIDRMKTCMRKDGKTEEEIKETVAQM